MTIASTERGCQFNLYNDKPAALRSSLRSETFLCGARNKSYPLCASNASSRISVMAPDRVSYLLRERIKSSYALDDPPGAANKPHIRSASRSFSDVKDPSGMLRASFLRTDLASFCDALDCRRLLHSR